MNKFIYVTCKNCLNTLINWAVFVDIVFFFFFWSESNDLCPTLGKVSKTNFILWRFWPLNTDSFGKSDHLY